MGKKDRLRRQQKEEAKKALKAELKDRQRRKLAPYARGGLFVGLAVLIPLVAILIGWSGSNLDARVAARFETKVKGPFGEMKKKELDGVKKATLKTSAGEIVIALFPKVTPKTVANFVLLARKGFYDGVKFHRVIKDFMIQTGDPESRGEDTSRYGTGGPGYTFEDELSGQEDYSRATVAMANSGPDTNGSQFFIVQKDQKDLPKSYTIFGRVVEGMEVVDKIAAVPVKNNDQGEKSLPIKPVILEKVVID